MERGTGANRDLRVGREVVLVWWSNQTSCERWVPIPALGAPRDEEVFLTLVPEPRERWVGGMPTFYVDRRWLLTNAVYAPSLERTRFAIVHPDSSARFATAREFSEFHRMLPRESRWNADAKSEVHRMQRWADRRPGIAGTAPVAEWLRQLQRLRQE